MSEAKSTPKDGQAGYKGHIEGSRKSKVHQLYDEGGAEQAWGLGLKLKLKENTLRSWFGAWGHGAQKKKVKAKAKPAAKTKPKKKAKHPVNVDNAAMATATT